MRLAEFITNEAELIADDFELFVKTHLTAAADLSSIELRNHILGVLTYIAADISTEQSPEAQTLKSKGRKVSSAGETAAQIHGTQRVDVGLAITDLAAEYRALRASILKHWLKQLEQPDQQDFLDMIRFNEAMDEAFSESLNRFHSLVEEARNYFLSVLGHDLRNPLSAILGCSTLLSESKNINDLERHLIAQVKASAINMNTITDNLLELARVKLGGGLTIERDPTDMGRLCAKAAEESRAAYPKSNIILDVEGDLQGVWDEMRLGQVLSNLTRNALEHGKPEGPVYIIAHGEDDAVIVEVHNKGSAIASDKIPYLFDRLKRADNKRGSQNLGLGLYITHEIITAHDGTISVTSSDTDGTTFTMRLPRNA